MMNINKEFEKTYKNKRILITGHTGFKGAWMAQWLSILGAQVWGASIDTLDEPSIYPLLKIKNLVEDIRVDLKDLSETKSLITRIKPDYIFHLAAQPLVLESIKDPIRTIYDNTIASINILESLKLVTKKTVCIFVTTDKVYENLNLNRGYIEDDKLAGKDIYSASKSMTEIAIKSYMFSFFSNIPDIKIATGRPCNCIGGGDWAENRLVPDIVKKWSKAEKVKIRNPEAIRPWQHVLEPVGAYIYLAYKLSNDNSLNGEVFNFGPNDSHNIKVEELLKKMKKDWRFNEYFIEQDTSHIEAPLLKINISKAKKNLNWKPVWGIDKTIKTTNLWYLEYYSNIKNINQYTIDQIIKYQEDASKVWI
jgi:CDP-glucose 4,6-dehydratase